MATTTTSTSDPTTQTTTDRPVLSVLTKRLRALRKKLNRITQMEQSFSAGKTLNNEQLDVLRSKPAVLTLIDELEKLRSPLAAALHEEISAVQSPPPQTVGNDFDVDDVIKDLVNLMYFGNLFDVRPQSEFTSLMLTRTHERGCCLTYDYVTDDDDDDRGGLLGEKDLDLISGLRELMVSKPVHSVLSHRDALEKCVHHAKLWLDKSNAPIVDSDSSVTYAGLREKLNKIMASDYFTATPQVKGPGEVAAAAAVGNFGSFEVSLHEPVRAVEVPVQVEGSAEQYQETEENVANGEQHEASNEDHSNNAVQEFHQDESEPENPPEVVSAQADQEQSQADTGGLRTTDFNEQQHIPRRGSQRGGRGGGGRRGGYPSSRGGRGSGRGGGPYQNGRGQYYDNYYPRSNYYNRRGGRGSGGGGGDSYHNQGNHHHGNVGAAS